MSSTYNLSLWLVLSYDLLEDRHTVDVPKHSMLLRDPIDSTLSSCSPVVHHCYSALFLFLTLTSLIFVSYLFLQIIQTPGLWEKDGTTGGVTLTTAGSQVISGCSGMCSLT